MKTVAAFGVLLALATPAAADEVGRYQAIPMPRADNGQYTQALILDTKDGHLWLWNAHPGLGGQTQIETLIYEGQVKPGKNMGDVIEHTSK